MANEFIARNGLISQNNSTITGSLLVSSSNATQLLVGSSSLFVSSAGNVGIGTTAPETKLHIEDVTKTLTGNVAGVAQGTLSLVTTDAQAADVGPSLIFGGNFTDSSSTRIAYAGIAGRKTNSTSVNADGYLSFLTWRSTGLTEAMRITPAGFLALGTTDAGVRFVNAGGVAASGPTLGSGAIGSQALVSENSLYGMWSGVSNNGDVWHQVQRNDGNTATYNLLFNPAGGNVGIGTTTPSTTLDIRTSGQGYITIGGVDGRTLTAYNNSGTASILNTGATSFDGFIYGSNFFDRGTNTQSVRLSTTTTSLWTSGSQRLTVSNAGLVGIGTLTPSTMLHVSGGCLTVNGSLTAYPTNGGIQLYYVGTTGFIATSQNAAGLNADLAFSVGNNAEKMRITSTGLVGIGTTTPTYRLQIDSAGSANTSVPLALTSVDVNNRVGILFGSSSLASGKQHRLFHRTNTSAAEWLVDTTAGSSANWVFIPTDNTAYAVQIVAPFATGSDARMYAGSNHRSLTLSAGGSNDALVIRSGSGNVGIGTASPSEKLSVGGNINLLLGSGGTKIGFNVGTGFTAYGTSKAHYGLTYSNDTNPVILSGYDGVSLFTRGAERLTVSSSGNVGIGTTSPAKLLDVNGDVLINGQTVGRGGGNISSNTTVGPASLFSNTTGTNNVSIGTSTMYTNTTGANNVAIGSSALGLINTSGNNVAIGQASLQNSTGGSNTAIGQSTLNSITSGNSNTALGRNAGRFIADKVTLLTSIDNSVLIGYQASPLGQAQTNQIVIGYDATGLGSNTTVLGNSSTTTTAIYGNVGIGTTTPTNRLTIHKWSTGGNFSNANQLKIQSDNWGGGAGYGLEIGYYHDWPTVYGSRIQSKTNNTGDSLLLNPDGGNVGIGTTTPNYKLDVSGSLNVAGAVTIASPLNVGSVPSALTTAGGVLLLANSKVAINSTGNVGIGTSTPESTLHLTSGSVGATGPVLYLDNIAASTLGNSSDIRFSTWTGESSTSPGAKISLVNTAASSGGNAFTFHTKNTSGVVAERVRFDSQGNVGIGTTAPSSKLDVIGGDIGISLNSWFGSYYNGQTTLRPILGFNNGDTILRSVAGTTGINFQNSSGITKMFLSETSGNVGIGTTSPNAKLDVSGSAIISGSLTSTGGFIKPGAGSEYLLADGTTTAGGGGGGSSTIIDDSVPTVVDGGTWYQPASGSFSVGITGSWVTVGRDGANGLDGAPGTVTTGSVSYITIASDLVSRITTSSGAWDFSQAGIIDATISSNTSASFSNLQLNKTLKIKIMVSGSAALSFPSYCKPTVGSVNPSGTNGTYYAYFDCWNATSGSEIVLQSIVQLA